ncbi:hypothetical protein a10_03439 [Streptomyces acidiscabies]|nr:hypothetical protein a10_03439 [Streptomyces acidiscabies]GAV41523.1 hypothetical protein Saa2_04428 [Streptomyces acidiscabies]
MHIPSYAYATIRAALPTMPTSRQVGALDCCLCDEPFGEQRGAVPLGPTPESGFFGCPPCLTRLVRQARQTRDTQLVRNAAQAQAEAALWEAKRDRYLANVESVREAAEAVGTLAQEGAVDAQRVAWLYVSLESAYSWAPENTPEPPESVGTDDSARDGRFRLDLEMISAREAVAERLVYHLINESMPAEPEMCEEFECPEGCDGRHDTDHIDCGPDMVFEDLLEHGIEIERPESPPYTAPVASEEPGDRKLSEEDMVTVLTYFGIDADDTEALLSAAAVGLVSIAWEEGLDDVTDEAESVPSRGEFRAQWADLYRRARTALLNAGERPEELLAFQAVAADVDLPWAGGSRFTLRSSGGPTEEFVKNVDNRVWFTSKLIREQGWRMALLHRATSAVSVGPDRFGTPGWPSTVAAAMERLAGLDLSEAPKVLADLPKVEAALLEAPDRLGVDALNWMSDHSLFV